MNKKIIISIIIIIVLAGVSIFMYRKAQAPSPENQFEVLNTKAQSSVGSGIGKTNPFNVDMNPYQGYKNPFQ